jgi:hypothetical protein
MSAADPEQPHGNLPNTLLGLGLLVAAGVVLFFTSGFVFQAFKGPQPITEQELLQITSPGWGDNYVSYAPSQPVVDTGVQWGKKNNPGTKYLLIPVGDRFMLCSARIAASGPKFVGRLEPFGGSEDEEVISRVAGSIPGLRQRLTPIMFQTVRSIWFDTSIALAAILGLGIGGLCVLLRPLIASQRAATTLDGLTPSEEEPEGEPGRAGDKIRSAGRGRGATDLRLRYPVFFLAKRLDMRSDGLVFTDLVMIEDPKLKGRAVVLFPDNATAESYRIIKDTGLNIYPVQAASELDEYLLSARCAGASHVALLPRSGSECTFIPLGEFLLRIEG